MMVTLNNFSMAVILNPLNEKFEYAKVKEVFSEWCAVNQGNLMAMLVCIIASIPIAIAVSVLVRLIVRLCIGWKKKDDRQIAKSLNKPILAGIIFTGVVIGIRQVPFPEKFMAFVNGLFFIVIVFIIAWALLRIVNGSREVLVKLAKKTPNVYDDLLVSLIYPVMKGIIWVVAILFIAENAFNFHITTLLAGAGIVAMAIAFAAQNTIANIFGALALIADRPFGIGDMIVVNGKRGAVTAIGLRSTSLRSLDGTVWCIPNKEIAEASIENISKRPNIKWAFTVDLVYGTTADQLVRAKEIVTEVLKSNPLTNVELNAPAVWFAEYAESSLRISAVNWFQTTNFGEFCAQREAIQLEILRRLEAENLEMAFNTQTVHVINEK